MDNYALGLTHHSREAGMGRCFTTLSARLGEPLNSAGGVRTGLPPKGAGAGARGPGRRRWPLGSSPWCSMVFVLLRARNPLRRRRGQRLLRLSCRRAACSEVHRLVTPKRIWKPYPSVVEVLCHPREGQAPNAPLQLKVGVWNAACKENSFMMHAYQISGRRYNCSSLNANKQGM